MKRLDRAIAARLFRSLASPGGKVAADQDLALMQAVYSRISCG
jgi:hypothetical protein